MDRGTRRRDERGESLLELLVAVTVLSVCVVAIGAGIALASRVSAQHRAESSAGAYLRSYADAVQSGVTYTSCASGYSVAYPLPAGFTASVVGVRYWSNATKSYRTTCASDEGLQLVTVQVSSQGTREQLGVVVRRP